MRHYYDKQLPVVYEDSLCGSRWLLNPTDPVQVSMGTLTDFIPELSTSSNIYICDIGGEGSRQPLKFRALTIVLSSPDAAHYDKWLTHVEAVELFMPSWSLEEVNEVVPTVYKQRCLKDGVTSIYPGRFHLYGGIARTIFSSASNFSLKKKLKSDIACCDLKKLFESITSGIRLGSLQQLVDYVHIDLKTYASANMDFASDEICDLIMKAYDHKSDNDVVSFLSSAAGKPEMADMRGKIFERYAHRKLRGGGTFNCRLLVQSSKATKARKGKARKKNRAKQAQEKTVTPTATKSEEPLQESPFLLTLPPMTELGIKDKDVRLSEKISLGVYFYSTDIESAYNNSNPYVFCCMYSL